MADVKKQKSPHLPSLEVPITGELRTLATEAVALLKRVYPTGNTGWVQPQAKLLVFKCSDRAAAAALSADLCRLGKVMVAESETPFDQYWCRQESANACRPPRKAWFAGAFEQLQTTHAHLHAKLYNKIRKILGPDRLVDFPRFFTTKWTKSRSVIAFLAHYLPPRLAEFCRDVARSRLSRHVANVEERRLIEAFLKSFSREDITHVTLVSREEEDEQAINLAHDAVTVFLRQVMASVEIERMVAGGNSTSPIASEPMQKSTHQGDSEPTDTRPLIELRLVGDDVLVTVAGAQCNLTNRGKRALIVVALLKREDWFSVIAFSRLYRGMLPDKTEARKDFDNPIRSLKKLIHGLRFEADDAGNRRLRDMRLRAEGSEGEFLNVLARLRNEPLSKEDRRVLRPKRGRGSKG